MPETFIDIDKIYENIPAYRALKNVNSDSVLYRCLRAQSCSMFNMAINLSLLKYTEAAIKDDIDFTSVVIYELRRLQHIVR